MMAFQIKNTPAESQYNGCGKAWVAVKNEQLVSIKYMGNFCFNPSKLPEWVKAVQNEYCTIADFESPIDYISSNRLGKLKKRAIATGHPANGPKGGYIKASDIARSAREIIQDAERYQFKLYRDNCRSELEKVGKVISGMCSCYEFVAN